jgi:hypothetical protein
VLKSDDGYYLWCPACIAASLPARCFNVNERERLVLTEIDRASSALPPVGQSTTVTHNAVVFVTGFESHGTNKGCSEKRNITFFIGSSQPYRILRNRTESPIVNKSFKNVAYIVQVLGNHSNK